MKSSRVARLLRLCCLLPVPLGCGAGATASQFVKPIPFEPTGQTKCSVRKSQSRPLIVEWPSADRAGLEALARRGVVVVRYADCEMQVLSGCQAPGAYDYVGTTIQQDEVVMRDEDELYANLPLGAASLEGRLKQGAQLTVSMSIVGTYAANKPIQQQDLTGSCSGATHYLRGLTVGSFDFYQEAAAELGGGATVAGFGATARSSSQRQSLNKAGDPASCKVATTKDSEPPNGCGALLRVEIEPIGVAGKAWKPAAAAPEEGRLKVAVSCDDGATLGPDDGLLVSTGATNQALAPVAVAQRWDEGRGGRTIDYVSFAIPTGSQRIRVHAPGCTSLEKDVAVDAEDPVVVAGALPPTSGTGPTAGPNPWRIGLSYVHTVANMAKFHSAFLDGNVYGAGEPVRMTLPGAGITGGLATGWFTLGMDLRVGRSSTTGSAYAAVYQETGGEEFGMHSFEGDMTMFYAGMRPGLRVPIDPVSVMAGSGAAVALHHFLPAEPTTEDGYEIDAGLLLPLWAQVEYAPVCDFSVNVMGGREIALAGNLDYVTVMGGITYQPNAPCRRDRRGEYSLGGEL